MKLILRSKRHWAITVEEQNPEYYPIIIGGETPKDEDQLLYKKAVACKVICLAISDEIVDAVAEILDPVVIWQTLRQ